MHAYAFRSPGVRKTVHDSVPGESLLASRARRVRSLKPRRPTHSRTSQAFAFRASSRNDADERVLAATEKGRSPFQDHARADRHRLLHGHRDGLTAVELDD